MRRRSKSVRMGGALDTVLRAISQARRQDPANLSTTPECFRDLGLPIVSRLKSYFVLTNGLRIHYRAHHSSGTPIVLIPGLVISSLYMIPLAERLALNYSVYALDLAGFGKSEGPKSMSMLEHAELLQRGMTRLGIPKAHVVANS